MLKRLIVALILCAPLWAQLAVPDFPTAPLANPSATITGFPYVANGANCPWVALHFDLASGSAVSCPGGAVMTRYNDSLFHIPSTQQTLTYYNSVLDFCTANSIPDCNENVFLHSARNYYGNNAWTWTGIGDYFQNSSTGNGTIAQFNHGSFVVHSGVFTDVTARLYGDPCCTPAVSMQAGDTLYFGYGEPIDTLNFVFTTPAVSSTVTWQYSTGSGGWDDLTAASHWSDSTSNLSVNGAATFYPPTLWRRDVANGSLSKYWIRVTSSAALTFTSVRTNPWTTNTACSDCGGHNSNFQGWSHSAWAASTACGGSPCTVDGIPYNPTPPTAGNGATARFPYVGAFNCYGGSPNRIWPNPSTLNGSDIIMASQLAWKNALPGVIPAGYNGVMQDNVAAITGCTATTPNIATLLSSLDLPCAPSCTMSGVLSNYYLPAFASAYTKIKATQASGFVVGWNNSGSAQIGETGTVYYDEFCNRAAGYEPHSNCWQAMDDAMLSTNTQGSVGYFQQIAPTKFSNLQDPGFPTVWHNLDADRQSSNIVGAFLMGDPWCQSSRTNCFNSTTYDYNYGGLVTTTSPNAAYTDTAGVPVYQNSSTLANPVAADSSGSPVTITLVDGSGILPVGGTYFAAAIQGRLCPSPTTCNDGDKVALTRTGANTFVTMNVGGGSVPPILHSYSAGSTFQSAATFTLNTLGSPPPWSNVAVWFALWQPNFATTIGKPDPTGYNGGKRSCGPDCATTDFPSPPPVYISGSANSCIGHAGADGCDPSTPATCANGTNPGNVWRRDFVNPAGQHNIVLVRDYGYQFRTCDFDWHGRNIDLSSARTDCAPNCTYQRVRSDGSLDAAGHVYNLRAGESAPLIQVTGGPPTLSITSGPCPNGTVGLPYNCNLTASGGVLPYNWSIIAGSLAGCPPLALTTVSNIGVISGTPSAPGSCSFTEQVQDEALTTQPQANSITISAPVSGVTSIKGTVKLSGSIVVK